MKASIIDIRYKMKDILRALEPALSAKGAPKDTRWSLLINTSVEGDV
jgi:hypothetical protein